MRLKISDSSWHGLHYAVVEPKIESWLPISAHIWDEMTAWCCTSFGERGNVWSDQAERWYTNGGKYYFRDLVDLELFMLKWA